MLYLFNYFSIQSDSNTYGSDGLSHLNCPLPIKEIFRFVPFTQSELDSYVQKNCEGKLFNYATTLPMVVRRCLLHKQPYKKIICEYLDQILCRILKGLQGADPNEAETLEYLYSFFHLDASLEGTGRTRLLYRGLVYYKKDKTLDLVVERSLLFNWLCSIAKGNHQLLEIEGAEELKFQTAAIKVRFKFAVLGQVELSKGDVYKATAKRE